jgi:hypothetical protein
MTTRFAVRFTGLWPALELFAMLHVEERMMCAQTSCPLTVMVTCGNVSLNTSI